MPVAPSLPAVAEELLLRRRYHERVRACAGPRRLQQVRTVDRANATALRGIIRDHGWPGHSLVGPDGADAAWLIAQHADHDWAFQWYCLALLQRAVEGGEATRAHLAYLTDRCYVNSGRAQLFGTQYSMRSGRLTVRETADPARLEARREAAGLVPFDVFDAAVRHDAGLIARTDIPLRPETVSGVEAGSLVAPEDARG